MIAFVAGLLIGVLLTVLLQAIAMLNAPDDGIVMWLGLGWVLISVHEDGYEVEFRTTNPFE